ncbi:MAG: hypothetical protein AAFY29_06655 [Pseudomonadota bacterium]
MLDYIKNFIFGLDPTSFVIGAIISGLIGLWLDFLIKQPKLILSGSGSGISPNNTKGVTLTLHNKVGWFGLMVYETRIFGLRLHPEFRKGLTFDKQPARDCTALLFLKETGENVGHLKWSIPGNRIEDTVTIESGKGANLKLFCRKADEDRYFIYQPSSRDDNAPLIPDQKIQFTGSQDFTLRVYYSHSRKLEETITIRRKYNGLLYLETKGSSSLF